MSITIDSLLISAEADVRWKSSTAAVHHRTVELHKDGVLYFFEEPKGSMAKIFREKVHLDDCHVVDGGCVESKMCVALFLHDYDYGQVLDGFGNEKQVLFDKPAVGKRKDDYYAVFLYFKDKVLKWRFLKTVLGTVQMGVTPVTAAPNKDGGENRVINRFDDLVGIPTSPKQTQSPKELGPRKRSSSLLSNHEVLQLNDVLKQYKVVQAAQQEEGRRMGSPAGAGGADAEEEELLLPPLSVPPGVTTSTSAPSSPLQDTKKKDHSSRSPASSSSEHDDHDDDEAVPPALAKSCLYGPCIAGDIANQSCADCGEAYPNWAVLQPFGCFVCIRCIGVHRQLWSEKCRGVELDEWPDVDVAFMQGRGNRAVNSELEFLVAYPERCMEANLGQRAVKPVGEYSSTGVRETYIRNKYADRLFTEERHPGAVRSLLPPPQDPVGLAAMQQAKGGLTDDVSSPASPGSEPPARHPNLFVDTVVGGSAGTDAGPPHYCGLVDLILKELTGAGFLSNTVCVVSNGFQELHSKVGRRLLNAQATAWDETMQLGVIEPSKPLYCAIYTAKDLIAVGEFFLPDDLTRRRGGGNSGSTGGSGNALMFGVTLRWCRLNKKPGGRSLDPWNVSFLLSYQPL